jgi:hypothetical protein
MARYARAHDMDSWLHAVVALVGSTGRASFASRVQTGAVLRFCDRFDKSGPWVHHVSVAGRPVWRANCALGGQSIERDVPSR